MFVDEQEVDENYRNSSYIGNIITIYPVTGQNKYMVIAKTYIVFLDI
jgi:hypothetical protein